MVNAALPREGSGPSPSIWLSEVFNELGPVYHCPSTSVPTSSRAYFIASSYGTPAIPQ
jgi:hypothetical protein